MINMLKIMENYHNHLVLMNSQLLKTLFLKWLLLLLIKNHETFLILIILDSLGIYIITSLDIKNLKEIMLNLLLWIYTNLITH